MAQYTIEDIEILRQKSGISYEEAVNLLEYHNGSLARSLVDLEKNGRIRDAKSSAHAYGYQRRHQGLFNRLYRTRFLVMKGSVPVLNISALFLIFAVMVAGWLVLGGVIAALLLGYRMRMERNHTAFMDDTLETMIQNAGQNVKATMYSLKRDLEAQQQTGANSEAPPHPPAEDPAPAPEVRTESPASGTTPVNVQFSEEGSMRVSERSDGYHEAEIQ
ncbi:MAG: hypothetical protein VB087_10640 [Candidatus Limiplasma sp.]|nr:hypothetical protein [Candidatus Limiplasma sp.]